MTGLFIIGLVLGIGLFIVRHLPPPLLTDPLDQLSLAVAGGLTVLSLGRESAIELRTVMGV